MVKVEADATNISNAMIEADEWCSYSQDSLDIVDSNDNLLATRQWCGCLSGLEDQEDPIQFGDFGYYSDWYVVE